MNKKTIDIAGSLRFGWETLRANFVLYLKLLLAVIVLAMIPGLVLTKIADVLGGLLGLPFQFLNVVWVTALGMGALKVCLKFCDRQSVDIPDLWSGLPNLLDFLIVKVLFTVIVSIGMILLLIPGCIWMVQFYLATYLVADRGTGAMEAMKRSSQITDGAKWDLGVFASVMFLVNLVGLLFLGVGLLITLPVTMLANTYVYRELLKQSEAMGTALK